MSRANSTSPFSTGALASPVLHEQQHVALDHARASYLRFLRSRNRAPKTLKAYRDSLAKFAAGIDKDLPSLARQDMEFYFDGLWTSLQPSSVLHHHKNLRAFFNWCAQDGLLDASPMQRMPEPSVKLDAIDPFTPEQVAGMFRAAADTRQPLRDQALVALLVSTGIRLGELCAIRPEDIQPGKLLIHGKGGKQRWVGLSPQTESLLNLHLARNSGAATVFGLGPYSGRRPEASAGPGLYWVVRRLAVTAGVRNAHPHRFRDTFAVRFLENGGGIDDLQVLLGHSNITTTLRYVMYGREQRAINGQMKYAPGVE